MQKGKHIHVQQRGELTCKTSQLFWWEIPDLCYADMHLPWSEVI